MNPFARRTSRSGIFCAALGALLIACVAGEASAQTSQPAGTRSTPCDPLTPNNAVCLQVDPPTVNVDGTPVVLPLTYRYEQKIGSGAWAPIAGAAAADAKLYVKNLTPGTYTFRAYVNCVGSGCIENPTPVVSISKDVTAPVIQPGTPKAILVVQVVIGMDHAPVYRTTQTGARDKRYSDACGYVPVGTECVGPVAFRFRDKGFRRVAVATVKEWVDCGANVAAPCS